MGVFDVFDRHSHSGGMAGALLRFTLRFFQFVLALVVAGLYGVDLHHATQHHAYYDGKWVYAEVVAALAAMTCLVYAVPIIKSYWFFAWDWIVFVLYTALFGIFGKMFIPFHPTPKQSGQIRMKHAVWVDLVNMIFWLVTAVYSTVLFFRNRNTMTLHTGRGKV